MFCKNKCSLCKNIVFINKITDAGDSIQLTLPNKLLCNDDRLCFIITEPIPITTSPVPVVFLINGIKMSYISKCGNFVYSDQIDTRKLYVASAKTDTNMFLNVRCNLNHTNKNIPCIEEPKPLRGSDKK